MDNFERSLSTKVMVIFDAEEVAHDGAQYPRECYASSFTGMGKWWHVKPPVLSQQDQQTFQVPGFKLTVITWETFEAAPNRPEENARDSDKALVDVLMSVRRNWNYPCEYPLIVGHKGGRENEKLFRRNQEWPGMNARALYLGNIGGFPTDDRIVGHVKKDKKGNVQPDQDPSPYAEDDVQDFIQANSCGVYHSGGYYKEKRQGAYHREWDRNYKLKCYSKKGSVDSGGWYPAPFNTYPPNRLHCPKVEVAVFWLWLRENHPDMIFDPESFKEYKEQKRAAMKANQQTRLPREFHPSQDPLAVGKAVAQPGPSTARQVTTSTQSQAVNTIGGQAPVAHSAEASRAAVLTESPKTPSVKVLEGTTLPGASTSGKETAEDEAMAEQGVVGAHFQSDGMDVQPKEEKEKTMAKGDHHGEEVQDICIELSSIGTNQDCHQSLQACGAEGGRIRMNLFESANSTTYNTPRGASGYSP